jgi:hypothetical protein
LEKKFLRKKIPYKKTSLLENSLEKKFLAWRFPGK